MSPASAGTRHIPVLLAEVIEALQPRPGGLYLDATLGGGGHSRALLEASAPDGRLLGLDRDPAAIERAGLALDAFSDRMSLQRCSFDRLDEVAMEAGFEAFDGMLFDLGISSDQLDDPERGLSFRAEGPLDMRLDPDLDQSAADLVNDLEVNELANLIYRYGDEPASRRIARAIVAARPIDSTLQLAQVIASAGGGRGRRGAGGQRGRRRIHPATRSFQALRIAVNDELGQIETALAKALPLLAIGGRIAVISFHSLEDRIVKNVLRDAASNCICPPELLICVCADRPRLRLLSRKPVEPGEAELEANPRSRSARLRRAERIA